MILGLKQHRGLFDCVWRSRAIQSVSVSLPVQLVCLCGRVERDYPTGTQSAAIPTGQQQFAVTVNVCSNSNRLTLQA